MDGVVWHLDVGSSHPGAGEPGLGCSGHKVARELGSERRETVRSLSVVGVGNFRRVTSFLVREDRVEHTSGVSVVTPVAVQSSYVWNG